jgi:hypothetical protein
LRLILQSMAILGTAAALAACASGASISATALDPARCQALKADLDAADSSGTSALAAQMADGTSLSPEQRSQVDAYHAALDAYVGGNCHTAGK